MITLFLWRTLQIPFDSNPLFRYVYSGRYSRYLFKAPTALLGWPTLGFDGILGKVFSGFTMMLFLCAGGWLVIVPMVVILPLIMFFLGTLNGLAVSTGVSRIIARERQRGREHLFAVTPHGIIGANWAICTAVYHRSNFLGQFRFTINNMYYAIYIGIIVFSIFLIGHWVNLSNQGLATESARLNFFNSLILMVIVIAFQFNYMQSIALGSLIGMIVPTYAESQSDARGLAMGLFLAIQVISYAMIILISFIILSELFELFVIEDALLLSIGRLGVFIGIRELILWLMWRLLAKRLDVDFGELSTEVGTRL